MEENLTESKMKTSGYGSTNEDEKLGYSDDTSSDNEKRNYY